ncbi:hypothetical protein Pmani_029297 [Petrolisthes manimaculis]|uniref:Uncharacterized protein n=1 Tax=Petrolisthes manimaculis TaxID=1843537 RepID=A0AAE1TUQ4_9EUCA|nr:hypothetical protein Pmani_029297 [Petrolisthes manimaculis]
MRVYGSLRYPTLTPATGPGHVWVHCLTVNVWPGSGARGALAAAPQAPPGPAHGPPAAPPPANHHNSLSKKAEFSGSTALLSFRVAEVGNAAGRQVRVFTTTVTTHHLITSHEVSPSLSTCRKLSSPRVCEYTHCYILTTTTSSHLTFTILHHSPPSPHFIISSKLYPVFTFIIWPQRLITLHHQHTTLHITHFTTNSPHHTTHTSYHTNITLHLHHYIASHLNSLNEISFSLESIWKKEA